jgi:hypothetical protein
MKGIGINVIKLFYSIIHKTFLISFLYTKLTFGFVFLDCLSPSDSYNCFPKGRSNPPFRREATCLRKAAPKVADQSEGVAAPKEGLLRYSKSQEKEGILSNKFYSFKKNKTKKQLIV